MSWDVQAFRWQNKAGFAGCVTVSSSDLLRLRPPSKSAKSLARLPLCLFPILGRLALSPAPFPAACTGVGMGGAARESWTCRFILRLHNATFTHSPAFRNGASRCRLMLAGLQVNAPDLTYIIL